MGIVSIAIVIVAEIVFGVTFAFLAFAKVHTRQREASRQSTKLTWWELCKVTCAAYVLPRTTRRSNIIFLYGLCVLPSSLYLLSPAARGSLEYAYACCFPNDILAHSSFQSQRNEKERNKTSSWCSQTELCNEARSSEEASTLLILNLHRLMWLTWEVQMMLRSQAPLGNEIDLEKCNGGIQYCILALDS